VPASSWEGDGSEVVSATAADCLARPGMGSRGRCMGLNGFDILGLHLLGVAAFVSLLVTASGVAEAFCAAVAAAAACRRALRALREDPWPRSSPGYPAKRPGSIKRFARIPVQADAGG